MYVCVYVCMALPNNSSPASFSVSVLLFVNVFIREYNREINDSNFSVESSDCRDVIYFWNDCKENMAERAERGEEDRAMKSTSITS